MPERLPIFDLVDLGLVVLDRDLVVRAWNPWMAHHSDQSADRMIGRSVLDVYPNLADSRSNRFIQSVLTFGSFAFFSQRLHGYLFPMKNPHPSASYLPFMQQRCTAGPLRNTSGAIVSLFISVQDVTDAVAYEIRLKQKVTELEVALATVKQLEGIIPICMYCKKVRDDQESWRGIEHYITMHSDAHFSHGICPECVAAEVWDRT